MASLPMLCRCLLLVGALVPFARAQLFDPQSYQIQSARRGVAAGATLQAGSLSLFYVEQGLTHVVQVSAAGCRCDVPAPDSGSRQTTRKHFHVMVLSPGPYLLTLIASDRGANQSSTSPTLSFRALEPWWKRRWFALFDSVAAFLFLALIWRINTRMLVARQQELESLVALRTRELEQEKTELLNARAALIEMTRRDHLTGLLNRAAIFERMRALCELSLATRAPLAVVMADLDFFKQINDEYGHVVGDAVIRECAARISSTIRPMDAVGRYGGEELLILIPGLQRDSAVHRMEELRLAISEEPVQHENLSISITCSFGVTWFTGKRCALESLVSMADSALYVAKRNGRNRVEYAVHDDDQSFLRTVQGS